VLEKLLAYGASVAVRSEDNLSPLHLTATLEGGLRCAQLLLAAGADVNSMDGENRTPLLVATCYD